jgi:hypothetical protein
MEIASRVTGGEVVPGGTLLNPGTAIGELNHAEGLNLL